MPSRSPFRHRKEVWRSQSGFTLIELLVTLSIVAVLATLVVPNAQLIQQRTKEHELRHALQFAERAVFRVGETNWRSRRAMEKIGGRLTGEIKRVPAPDGREIVHVVYEITRSDFARGPLCGDAPPPGGPIER